MRLRSFVRALALASLLLPSPSSAQLPLVTDPGRSVRTRADLERLLAEYDAALASPAYSDAVKRSIAADADRIRGRLRDGDFRVGDRIDISVQGEANFPVTVTVQPGPVIVLDLFGEISLAGVLRSEIVPHLTQALGRFIRNPVVRATAHMRLSVLGAVGTPGFYTVPAETLLGDLIMAAGGPQTPDLDDLRIERAGQPLYERSQVQDALREGFTLDQLNLQAGDQIVLPIPSQTNFLFGTVLPILGAIGSLSFLLFQVGIF
jgi:hypothetical protein